MRTPTYYGYIRVSSKEQNEARQLIAIRDVGVLEEHIYIDKKSGSDFDRPQYQRLMKKLKPGDVLVVKSIDRLGRNYDQIQEQWRVLTKEKHVDIHVIDMPLLDTRQCHDLLRTLIADIVLQVLSFVAENEREAIRQRQAEGIAAAKARGVVFGRPERPLPKGFDEVYRKYRSGEITGSEAARLCGMSLPTFRYKARKYGERK